MDHRTFLIRVNLCPIKFTGLKQTYRRLTSFNTVKRPRFSFESQVFPAMSVEKYLQRHFSLA